MSKKLELHKVQLKGSNNIHWAYSDRVGDYYLLGDVYCEQPLPLSIDLVTQIDSKGHWVDGSQFSVIERVNKTEDIVRVKPFKRFTLCNLEIQESKVSHPRGELVLGIHDMLNNDYALVEQEYVTLNCVLELVKLANERQSVFPLLTQGIIWLNIKVREV